MELAAAVKKYFTGDNKDSKIRRFEELQKSIDSATADLDIAVKGLNTYIGGVDVIKKAATTVIGTEGVTSDNITVALDNMRFADRGLSEYMDGFTHTTKQHKETLEKSVKEMAKLIEDNPNIAEILINVKHDENLEKAFEDVLIAYKAGSVDRKLVIEAYNSANEAKRTDRDFSIVFNKYLKD